MDLQEGIKYLQKGHKFLSDGILDFGIWSECK